MAENIAMPLRRAPVKVFMIPYYAYIDKALLHHVP